MCTSNMGLQALAEAGWRCEHSAHKEPQSREKQMGISVTSRNCRRALCAKKCSFKKVSTIGKEKQHLVHGSTK